MSRLAEEWARKAGLKNPKATVRNGWTYLYCDGPRGERYSARRKGVAWSAVVELVDFMRGRL